MGHERPLGSARRPYDANYPGTFGSLGIGWYVEKLFTGQIWAATLLEIARNTDRSVLLQVVVDSLKLMPKNPNFFRRATPCIPRSDHLKQAGRVTTTQADSYRQAMKRAFARFGMGVDAGSTGNTLFDITPDFTVDGTSLKPPVKVIGLGGMSSDGNAAYVNGNDGSIWRYQFASHGWTEAAVRGVLKRCTKMYWIGTDGTEAIAKREAAGHGRLVQANAQWSWTTFSPPSNFTGLTGTDIVRDSHDGKILWWAGADTSTNPPSAKFSKQSRDASGSWQSQSGHARHRWPGRGRELRRRNPGVLGFHQRASQAVGGERGDRHGRSVRRLHHQLQRGQHERRRPKRLRADHAGRLWGLRKVQNAWPWTDLSANQTVPMQTLRASSNAGKVFLSAATAIFWQRRLGRDERRELAGSHPPRAAHRRRRASCASTLPPTDRRPWSPARTSISGR